MVETQHGLRVGRRRLEGEPGGCRDSAKRGGLRRRARNVNSWRAPAERAQARHAGARDVGVGSAQRIARRIRVPAAYEVSEGAGRAGARLGPVAVGGTDHERLRGDRYQQAGDARNGGGPGGRDAVRDHRATSSSALFTPGSAAVAATATTGTSPPKGCAPVPSK